MAQDEQSIEDAAQSLGRAERPWILSYGRRQSYRYGCVLSLLSLPRGNALIGRAGILAAHSNDPVAHIHDILAYQETVQEVKAFVDRECHCFI